MKTAFSPQPKSAIWHQCTDFHFHLNFIKPKSKSHWDWGPIWQWRPSHVAAKIVQKQAINKKKTIFKIPFPNYPKWKWSRKHVKVFSNLCLNFRDRQQTCDLRPWLQDELNSAKVWQKFAQNGFIDKNIPMTQHNDGNKWRHCAAALM